MQINGALIGADEIEERFDQGAIEYSRWFGKTMDLNGWSHPKLVQLAKHVTGDKGYVHSSQIAALRTGTLKSPGPRSFASLVYLFHEIDLYQKGKQHKKSPTFKGFEALVENAVVMRDDDDNVATIGFHFECFVGWRKPPQKAATIDYSPEQAEKISKNAGKYIRMLMVAEKMDPLEDIDRLAKAFSGDQMIQAQFCNVVWGRESWKPDELDSSLQCVSNMLLKIFKTKLKSTELMHQFLR